MKDRRKRGKKRKPDATGKLVVSVKLDAFPTMEQRLELGRVGAICQRARNALWLHYFRQTKVDVAKFLIEQAEARKAFAIWKKAGGKKSGEPQPVFPSLELPGRREATRLVKRLCQGVPSVVYDQIHYDVQKRYAKICKDVVTGVVSLPRAKDPAVEIRATGVSVRRDPEEPRNVQFGFKLAIDGRKSEPLWVSVATPAGKRFAPGVRKWLEELADGTGATMGACRVFRQEIDGKKRWFVATSRKIVPEKADCIPGRALLCGPLTDPTLQQFPLAVPNLNRCEFLVCEAYPVNGPAWRVALEWRSLSNACKRSAARMEAMAWRQSKESAAHGRGHKRAMLHRARCGERLERRINAFIENRSREVVELAKRMRCERIKLENLTAYKGVRVLGNNFPYHRFALRISQKAQAAGIGFEEMEARTPAA